MFYITSLIAIFLDRIGWNDSAPGYLLAVNEKDVDSWTSFLTEKLGNGGHLDTYPGGMWTWGDDLANESLYFRGLFPFWLKSTPEVTSLINELMYSCKIDEVNLYRHHLVWTEETAEHEFFESKLSSVPKIRDWDTEEDEDD